MLTVAGKWKLVLNVSACQFGDGFTLIGLFLSVVLSFLFQIAATIAKSGVLYNKP